MPDGHAGHCGVNGNTAIRIVAQKPTIHTKIRILGDFIAHTHNAIIWSPGKLEEITQAGTSNIFRRLKSLSIRCRQRNEMRTSDIEVAINR